MTPEKLDELYELAKKVQELPYNSQNPQAVEDFNDATKPDVVAALIDRVRELEGENNMLRPALEQCERFISNLEKESGREMLSGISARAALERSEILNKE